MSSPVPLQGVRRARTFLQPSLEPTSNPLAISRIRGRVVECSEAGSFGALSLLAGVMGEFQAQGDQVVWIATTSVFFPPDLAFRGLDLNAVSVVWAPGETSGLQVADWLLRSGAFGLIVIDWMGQGADDAILGRLAKLAQDRQTTLFFLTRKKPTDSSLGALVSLRLAVSRAIAESEVRIMKDKRAGPAGTQRITFYGPLGMY